MERVSGEFLAPSGAQEMLIFVRSFDESLSRALNLHLKVVWVSPRAVLGQSQVSLRSVSGQPQVSLRSVSGQSKVSLRSASGQSQVGLRSLCAHFVRQKEPKILCLV